MIRLHGYYRSSTSYRLRIALELKGLDYEYVPVNLLTSEQKGAAFTARNPFGSVPLLEVDGKDRVQSMAIIEWLEETRPEPALLPADADGRARVRALAYMIACEVHPLNNLRVLGYLAERFGADGCWKILGSSTPRNDAMSPRLTSLSIAGKAGHRKRLLSMQFRR